mmetsp:Transcript_27330/g.78774  ORF Transcript_27330/g.78774 Transcript_27330/m.78774 type:complete len:259 (+) Transcript_27330:1643-2419(+)
MVCFGRGNNVVTTGSHLSSASCQAGSGSQAGALAALGSRILGKSGYDVGRFLDDDDDDDDVCVGANRHAAMPTCITRNQVSGGAADFNITSTCGLFFPIKMKYSSPIAVAAAVSFATGAGAFSPTITLSSSQHQSPTVLGAISRRESFAKAAALVGGLAVSGAAPATAEESLDFSLPSYESSLKNTGGFGDGNEAILNVKADSSEAAKQKEAMRKAEEARQAAKEAKMAERKALDEETKRRAAEKKKRDADRLKGIFE